MGNVSSLGYEGRLQEWKDICAAMKAEEAAAEAAGQPNCFWGALYCGQQSCGLCFEIPLRCSWHAGCAISVCLLCGPIGWCSEGCERICTKDTTPLGAKLQSQSDTHGSEGGSVVIPSRPATTDAHAQPSDEIQPERPNSSHSRLYYESANHYVNPCCISIEACILRHCWALSLYNSLAHLLCENLCESATFGTPLYVYAQDVALQRPPMPKPPRWNIFGGGAGDGGCCDCDKCCVLNCDFDCKDDCTPLDCCTLACLACCNSIEARSLYRRELVSMLFVLGGMPESCHPSVCIGPPPPVNPRQHLDQSDSCWESEEARMLRWADEYFAEMDARTALFYDRLAANPGRYSYKRSASGTVTAEIDESSPAEEAAIEVAVPVAAIAMQRL